MAGFAQMMPLPAAAAFGAREQAIIKQLVLSEIRGNFAGSHSPDGIPWLPLKRERPRGGSRPLRDTGLLMASVTAEWQGNTLAAGSNLNYAAVHQYGHTFHRPARRRDPKTQKPWVFTTDDGRRVFTYSIRAHTQTIPARPYVGISERLLDRIEIIIADAVEKSLTEERPGGYLSRIIAWLQGLLVSLGVL